MAEAVTLSQLQAALAPLFDKITALDAKLDAKVSALDDKITALDAKLDAKVSALDGKITALDAKVTALSAMVGRLEAARVNDAVRAANRLKALTVALVPLRFDSEGAAWPDDVDQPPTFLSLAVSGAESMPGGAGRTPWNRMKSRRFLNAAVSGYLDDGTDNEGEAGTKSRTLRLKVIEAVGGIYERVIGNTHVLN